MNAPAININFPSGPSPLSAEEVYQKTKSTLEEYHRDASVPGIELRDYIHRVPSDDGTYVRITEHREWIEKVKQPPTPEEIAARRERQKKDDKIVLGCLGLLAVGFGAFVYFDSKRMGAAVDTAGKVADVVEKASKK